MSDVINILTELVDEVISISVVGSTIALLALGYNLPEWWIGAFGLVIGHFFTKSAKNGAVVETIKKTIKNDCIEP